MEKNGCVTNDEMCRDFAQTTGSCSRCTWYSILTKDAFAGDHCKVKWYLVVAFIITFCVLITLACFLTVFFLQYYICPKEYLGKLNKPFKNKEKRIERPKDPFNYVTDDYNPYRGNKVR